MCGGVLIFLVPQCNIKKNGSYAFMLEISQDFAVFILS